MNRSASNDHDDDGKNEDENKADGNQDKEEGGQGVG